MDNRLIVVVGMGMLSPIGSTLEEVQKHMREGISGISVSPSAFQELGIKSKVYGAVNPQYEDILGTKIPKSLSEQGRMAYYAAVQAFRSAGMVDNTDTLLPPFKGPRTGVYVGTGGSPIETVLHHVGNATSRNLSPKEQRRIDIFLKRAVQQVMTNTVSAGLGVAFEVQGETISVASACATSHHNIITAARSILSGELDVAVAGGVEDTCRYTTFFFDTIPALSSGWNDNPTAASRPFDSKRDGFVPSSGAGIVILTTKSFAQKHNLPILAYLKGWGSNANGASMVKPAVEGEVRVMELALGRSGLQPSDIDLISAHGTSTPDGDAVEAAAILEVFGDDGPYPYVNSGKSLTGHGLGAAGAWSVIMTILQMQHKFMHESLNIVKPDEVCQRLSLVRACTVDVGIQTALVNAFGFGGTNASLVLTKTI